MLNQIKKSAILSAIIVFAALISIGFIFQYFHADIYWSGYIAMAFFYAIMFYLGVAASNKEGLNTKNQLEETLLAGRSLPLGIGLMTMTATWVGGGFINGTAEAVASDGLIWAQAPWGYALSLILGGLLFAKPMRRHNFTTMLDPLEDRYGQRMAALLYLPALLGEIFWTGAILTALGTTFGFILGIDFSLSIIFSAAVVILYTALGGMRAVANTDVLQLAVLIIGLILALPFVLPEGGISQVLNQYNLKMGENANLFPSSDWSGLHYLWWDYALLLVFGGIPWHVYFQRVLSSKDEHAAKWLSISAGGLCIIAALPAVIIGMVSATTDWASLGISEPITNAIALPHVIKSLSPPIVATIGLGALAAAVMSSVDSSILSASSMGAWNIYRPLMQRKNKKLYLNKVVKRLIFIVGIAATIVALKIQSVYELWFLCSDFVYCLLFPQLLTALYDKKANAIGSFSGFIVAFILRMGGGETTLGIPNLIAYPMTDIDGTIYFPFRTFSMLCGLLTIIIVSRLSVRWSSPRTLIQR